MHKTKGHKETVRPLQMPAQVIGNRPQVEAGPADPDAQSGAVQVDALAGSITLSIRGRCFRQMLGVAPCRVRPVQSRYLPAAG